MKSLNRYKNSFYSPKNIDARLFIETDAMPVLYKGYLIFHRQKSNTPGANIWDVVKAGYCIGMYAGLQSAKRFIDYLIKRHEKTTRRQA